MRKDKKMIRLSAFSDEAGDSLKTQIEALHRNGISLTEMRSVDKRNVSTFTLAEAREMQAMLKGEGIGLSAVGSPLGKTNITTDFSEIETMLRHLCELANVFETDRIRMFSFHQAQNERSRVIENLQRMVEIADSYGVGLYHENEKGIYGDTAERVEDLMRSVEGLHFVYDPANFLQVGEPAENTLERFCDRCAYFHVKDVVQETGELVPAGNGDGNIPKLLQLLKGRNTILTVEPHLKLFGAYKQIDGTEMNIRYHFDTNDQAFDAAVGALRSCFTQVGYREENGAFYCNK